MADKPQKCVVVYGDGFLLDEEKGDGQVTVPTTLEEANLEHLHLVAKDGCSGFLALRELAAADGEVERSLSDLAQLLDVHELYTAEMRGEDCAGTSAASTPSLPSLSERFKGMPAAFLTNSRPAASIASRVGMSLLPFGDSANVLPGASATAERVLALLKLDDGAATSPADVAAAPASSAPPFPASYDLVVIHVHQLALATENSTFERSSAVRGLRWIDSLLGRLRALSPAGSSAARHLYIATLLSYPSSALSQPGTETGLPGWDALKPNPGLPPGILKLRPKQSYRSKGGQDVPSVRDHHPILAVYHLDAVTRRDACQRAGVRECREHGSNLAILADRFLHELAFKLWRAPKYGA